MTKVCVKILSFVRRYWLHLLLALVLILVYRGWFSRGPLTYGDWGYHSHLMLTHYFNIPFVWEPAISLGKANLDSIYFMPQHFLWGLLAELHFSYALSERLIWFLPSVLIAVLSSYYLGKTVFRDRQAACITAATFTLSTYFLRITTQGSVAIGTSIALTPLVLALLLRAARERGLRYPVLAGLALWLQGSYDLRFCYLTILIAVAGWSLLAIGSVRRGHEGLREAVRRGGYLALAFAIFVGASFYWIIPNFMSAGFQPPSNYGQAWWIPILSFGKLVHGLTMYDPGWPALTFTRLANRGANPVNPFFVLFPIIGFSAAFLALRGIKKDLYKAKVALAGSAFVIVGAFLAKGSNNPLGGVYLWLFDHLPGFKLFRDPNKMFLFIILGYSILFGLAAIVTGEWLRERFRAKTWQSELAKGVPALLILIVLCLLALPALSGHLGGINSASRPVKVPEGYKKLDRQLEGDRDFYRTLWYPDVQRFATKGPAHPAVSAKDLFSGNLAPLALTEQPMTAIANPLMPGLLDAMAVRRIIVPEDADVLDFRLYRGEFRWESPIIKKRSQGLVAAVPGNKKALSVGGSKVYIRKDGKGHVFVPEMSVGILGDWGTALEVNGAPGLDLNQDAYFLSEEAETATPAFGKRFPADALVSSKPTALDVTMPFVNKKHLVPVSGSIPAGSESGWISLSSADFVPTATALVHSKDFDDRSLDYGLGGALSPSGYAEPPKGWQKQAKLLKTIDVSAVPIPFFTTYEGLQLEQDVSRERGAAVLRGALSTVRTLRNPRIAYSDAVPVVPFHPYGIRFRVAGEKLQKVTFKISFFNSIGEWIGEQGLFTAFGTFDFKEFLDQFVPPADTAYCRFEVDARESEAYHSYWYLENVNIYDLQGISRHPEFMVPATVGKKGNYHLMTRCFGFEADGRIAFSVDGGKEIYLDTYSPAGRMTWLDIGRLGLAAGQHQIEVTNLAGENLVNTLALVTDKQLADTGRSISKAAEGKDMAYAADLVSYPRSISYSRGEVTRTGRVYCPVGAVLVPTFKDRRDRARSGIRLRLGGTDYDLSRGVVPSGKAGWASLPEVTVPRGSLGFQVRYPANSLVNLPASARSPGGKGKDWSVATDGVTLAAGNSPAGEPSLTGQVSPGDESVERVAQSNTVLVSGNTNYSALFNLEGKGCNKLFFSLNAYDYYGKLVDRVALTREMNGTFASQTTFKKIKLRNGARFVALEVVCHADPVKTSSWRLSGLLFNRTSLVEPSVRRIVMVPGSWAFPASAPMKAAPAEANLLKSGYTDYKVKISDAKKPFVLVFSEQYSPDWEMHSGSKVVSPVSGYTLLNCYPLYRNGTYEVTLSYRPQKWVNIGLIISILTLLTCLAFLIISRYRRKRRDRGEAARAQE